MKTTNINGTTTTTNIALSSLSSDLYSIHQKLFSVENLAYAASQLAMGADINDVARFVVVNTIATSAVDGGFFALEKQRIVVFSKKRQQGACDAVAGTSRLVAKRTKAAKCVEATSDYFLLNLRTRNKTFANDNFKTTRMADVSIRNCFTI